MGWMGNAPGYQRAAIDLFRRHGLALGRGVPAASGCRDLDPGRGVRRRRLARALGAAGAAPHAEPPPARGEPRPRPPLFAPQFGGRPPAVTTPGSTPHSPPPRLGPRA